MTNQPSQPSTPKAAYREWIEIRKGSDMPEERSEVDVWMRVYASPRSMGWADSFRVPNAYRKDEKWFHKERGVELELYSGYITHWMPLPDPPSSSETVSRGE